MPETPTVPPALGERLDVRIDRLAYGGDGVARPGGFTLFVPRAAPGDELAVRVVTLRKRYGRAFPEKLRAPSSHRVEARCARFAECGGCHYQHLDPEFAARAKVDQLRETWERLGPGRPEILPLVRPLPEWNYRNRVTYHRAPGGAQGYVGWRDKRVVDVESCPIAQEELNRLWKEMRPRIAPISPSLLPFVALRRTSAGETAAIFSLTSWTGLDTLDPALSGLPPLRSTYATVVKAGSPSPFGKEMKRISGSGHITEVVGGLRYSLRPDLFFQVHPGVADRLLQDVVAALRATGAKNVLDIFCGAGLFTLAAARAGIRALGVEANFESVKAAQRSVSLNRLDSACRFRAGKADRIAERLFREGQRFDAAVVDPPRRGLPPGVRGALPRLGVARFLYVSCSPPTLARDAKEFLDLGYRPEWVRPYDMFPQTYHMETLTMFART